MAYEIQCWTDCSAQIKELIYIINVNVYPCFDATLHKLYIFNMSSISFVDISTYNSVFNGSLLVWDVCVSPCVATNNTHIFVVNVQDIVIYDIDLDSYFIETFEAPLFYQSSCSMDNSLKYLYIMGGLIDGQAVYLYDTQHNVLSLLSAKSKVSHYNSYAVTTIDNYIVIFGGMHTNPDIFVKHYTESDAYALMSGEDTTDKYYGFVYDINTETFFNVSINDYYPYCGVLYMENSNKIIRSGGWSNASKYDYKHSLYSFQSYEVSQLSTYISFDWNLHVMPGQNLFINYSLETNGYIMQYALKIALFSSELSVDLQMIINPQMNQCAICSTGTCYECSVGLFLSIKSVNMIGKSYKVYTTSHSAGLRIYHDYVTVNISFCEPGYGLNNSTDILNCVECAFNSFTLSSGATECIICDENVDPAIHCFGSNIAIIPYNHWVYGIDEENKLIPSLYDIRNNDKIHLSVCPPNICCLQNNGCDYSKDKNNLCANGGNISSVLCSSCIDGYYELFTTNQCGKCDKYSNIFWLLIPFFISAVFIAYILCADSSIPKIEKPIRYNKYVVRDKRVGLQTLFFQILMYYYQSLSQLLSDRGVANYLHPIFSLFDFSLSGPASNSNN
eukprot:101952_1